jgi:hypothetical protein
LKPIPRCISPSISHAPISRKSLDGNNQKPTAVIVLAITWCHKKIDFKMSSFKLLFNLPFLFTALVVWYCIDSSPFEPIIELIPLKKAGERIYDVIAYPATISEAFKLGNAVAEGGVIALEKARVILKAPMLTEQNLQRVGFYKKWGFLFVC